MDSSTIIWLVVALVALALLALLFSRSRARRADSQRAQAAEIRDERLQDPVVGIVVPADAVIVQRALQHPLGVIVHDHAFDFGGHTHDC